MAVTQSGSISSEENGLCTQNRTVRRVSQINIEAADYSSILWLKRKSWLNIRPQDLLFAVLPVSALIAITLFRFSHFAQYAYLIQEDGPLENLQFLGYLAAGVILGLTGILQICQTKLAQTSFSKKTSILLDKRILGTLCLLMAIVLTLVAFEEISWGQRVEQLKTPTYFAQHNVQDELTLHNLDFIQPFLEWGYLCLGIFLSTFRPILELLTKILKKFAGQQHPSALRKKITVTLLIFLPRWDLTGYFLPVSMIYAVLMFYKPFGIILKTGVPLMIGRDQELGETLLALGLCIQSIRIYKLLLPELKNLTLKIVPLKQIKFRLQLS